LALAARWQVITKVTVTGVMSPSAEDQLISLLTEIHSDIRQIKSDLQSLLTLLTQQQKPTTTTVSGDDLTPEPLETAQSGSPQDVLRYLREMRGDDDTGE
jgi:hypothetical protein